MSNSNFSNSNDQPSDIAICGIGTLLPKAHYPDIYWENIIRKVSGITEIPRDRWDWRLYYDPDRKARDKIYSKWGGFIEEVAFDPVKFGIPPKSLKFIDPIQLLTLEAVRRALADAGYESGNFDRENTSVILGAGTAAGDYISQYTTRSHLPLYVDSITEETWDRLPEWTEESFPGILLNVAAGRVANRFDLGGINFAIDAACASSLAALYLAVRELESGRSNVVITGGADTGQSPAAYLSFSKTQALSARQQPAAFDEDRDGIVISEGIAILVLKRLADAERDGDSIYGIIKAIAGSSDGKALGLTAPRPAGQRVALDRAYTKAGFSPNTLGLYEAHGTGTVAGDKAEAETVTTALKDAGTSPKSCAIGSVKTVIGHTKSSAGVAGLVKAVLALRYKVLPPHLGVQNPIEAFAESESPVYLLKDARPWFSHPNYPRRAGVSAFGFGGTNFHAVLEEYAGNSPKIGDFQSEVFLWDAPNQEGLINILQQWKKALNTSTLKLRDIAYTLTSNLQNLPVRLSIVASSLSELQLGIETAITHFSQNSPLPTHIQYFQSKTAKIAFLFPGQGAQYPDMGREVALYFEEMRLTLETADRQLQSAFPKLLSQYIYPPSAYSEATEAENRTALNHTRIAQPAIGAVEAGFLRLADSLGIKPDVICGHSFGEFSALYAAGVLTFEDFLKLSEIRGQVMAAAFSDEAGAMAAIGMSREELQELISGTSLVIANHNAPLQSVISGRQDLVENLVDQLNQRGILARVLPVSGAFHSPLVASAQVELEKAIASTPFHSPTVPVFSNITAQPYHGDIQEQLSQHLRSPVEFVRQIEAMYDSGVRIFLEVGPKSILTNLVGQILTQKEHTAVSLDGQGGGIKGFLMALGTLWTRGINVNYPKLFEGRTCQEIDLNNLPSPPDYTATTWFIGGATARPISEASGHMAKLPPLTVETLQPTVTNDRASVKSPIDNSKETSTSKPLPNTSSVNNGKGSHSNNQPLADVPLISNSKITSTPQSQTVNHPMTNQPQPIQGSDALTAYLAYQETMRQFLSLQEQVMKQFLGTSTQNSTPQPRQITQTSPLSQPNLTENGTNGHQLIAKENGNLNTPSPFVEATPTSAITNNSPKSAPSTPTITENYNTSTQPTRESLTQILLQLVSDRTGYPIEMLGLNQDLEAELGIDSIKRVEIFGALGKALPSLNLHSRINSFSRIKTLNEIIEQLLNSTAVVTDNSIKPTQLTPESLTQILLQLVSDRTGYPIEMLGLNQDLEAELGIDSIKRVEIFGALGKALPSLNLHSRINSFSRIKTLNEIIEQLQVEETRLGKS